MPSQAGEEAGITIPITMHHTRLYNDTAVDLVNYLVQSSSIIEDVCVGNYEDLQVENFCSIKFCWPCVVVLGDILVFLVIKGINMVRY